MSDLPLDHVHDLMIRALYEELGDDERRELELLLTARPEIASEWRDLVATRESLAAVTEGHTRVDSPFELPALETSPVHPARLWRWHLPAAAAGFAAAALIFCGLLMAGLRVDRSDAGILIGFAADQVRNDRIELALQTADYVSRAELAATTQAIFDATVIRLDEIERRQTGTQAELARSLYGALSERQDLQYADLKQRITYAAIAGPTASRRGGAMTPRVWPEPTED